MNTLYIIGNGFDLAHGLKTSYSDFLLWYLKQCASKKRAELIFDDGLIKIEGKLRFGDFKPIDNIKDFLDFFVFNSLNFTPLGSFMHSIFADEQEFNWVDIESKYYKTLLSYLEVDVTRQNGGIIRLNYQLKILKQKLEEYLILLDKSIVHNDEIGLHFSNDSREIDNRLVLNFNFTSTVDHYIKESSNTQIINIHGRLEDPENQIIFGYGDEMHQDYESIERLDIDEYLVNFKSFGYLRNSNYSFFEDFINMPTLNFNVKILGHSCGLSDRVLLSTIFQHDNCKGIEICYHQRSILRDDHYEKTIRISRHFSTAMKAKMRSKIIPKDKSKPLRSLKK